MHHRTLQFKLLVVVDTIQNVSGDLQQIIYLFAGYRLHRNILIMDLLQHIGVFLEGLPLELLVGVDFVTFRIQ